MVKGIAIFKEYFRDFSGSYIIIGGTACDIVTEEAGFVPRATVDIDMVLIVEALDGAFVNRFWGFIVSGGYNKKEQDKERRCCYRFSDPQNDEFPQQIELFSRMPDVFTEDQLKHLTPIPVEEGLSYLSAILLDENYYRYTLEHCRLVDDVRFAGTEALICLKAFAYLSNKRRKEEGQNVRERDIVKHKYDVFRMIFLLDPDLRLELPERIKNDLQQFAKAVRNDLPPRDIFKVNGFETDDMSRLFEQMLRNYNLNDK